jgi:TolB-like protein/Tfp pilus assembly protein PilF
VPNVLPNSVAVLPFANLSPDPDNAFFAAGIHDTILHELAKVSDLNVVSRTVMLRYAEENTPIRQIAEELNVQSVMEGSVQYAGGRVLVTAQLIDPQTNLHLWSENYDRDFSDIFAIQSEIATRIAEAMQAQLSPEERERIEVQMTESPEAYALYLRAMDLADWDFSPDDSTDEIHSLLDEAISHDPAFARAYSAKANIYSFNRHELPFAMEFANKALALDPDLGSAYSAIGMVHMRSMNNEDAINAFETALELTPNDINISDDFSRFLSRIGYYERSIIIARRVLQLDPGRMRLMAVQQWRAGDVEAALETIRQGVAISPNHYGTRVLSALLEHFAGNSVASDRETRIARSLRQIDSLSLVTLAQDSQRFNILGLEEDAAEMFKLIVKQVAERPGELWILPGGSEPAWAWPITIVHSSI